MATAFKAGLIQTNVSNDMAENVAFVREQARLARSAGADFIMTPENTGLIGANRTETLEKAQTEETHAMLAAASASARETGAWFLLGSIHVRVPGEEQIRNRSYLIDSFGGIVASYDKIHMFDVQLAGGESYRESSTFRPGEKSVLVETPWGVLGMTICYDLRFPYLYRDLAHAGATMLSIPSSFTVPTGQAHWHALMRARAIEDHCSGLVTIMTLGSSGSVLIEKPSLRARPSIGAFSLSTSPQISRMPRRWQHSTISSRSRRPRPWPFRSERTAPAYSARAPSGSAKMLIIPRIAGFSA